MGHLQGSRYQSASERLLGRPTRRYARSRCRTDRPTTQCRPSGLDHLTESRTLDGSFSHRPLHLAQDTLRLVRPSDGGLSSRSANSLPTVFQRSATNGIRSVCLRLNVRFRVRDGRWVRRCRAHRARSYGAPLCRAGGDRGAQQFPLVTRGSRMRIGRGLHPIQGQTVKDDDVELGVSER